MTVRLLGSLILSNALLLKAEFPIVLIESGKEISFRLAQYANAIFSMLCAPSGMKTVVSLRQSNKSEFSITVSVEGSEIFVKLLQVKKADFPILVIPSEISTLVMLWQ